MRDEPDYLPARQAQDLFCFLDQCFAVPSHQDVSSYSFHSKAKQKIYHNKIGSDQSKTFVQMVRF